MHLTRTLPTLCLALLAGCSSSKTEQSPAGGEAAKAPEPVAQAPAEPAGEKVVNLYTWADYFTKEVLDQFTKDTGIKVVVDTFDSNEALMGKLQGGATGYDVIVPSDYTITILGKMGQIIELDHSKLPNLSNLEDSFRNPPYDPGNRYAAPFQFGTTVIGYLSDKIQGTPDSWALAFKPTDKTKGRISLLKDAREVLGAALKFQGKSYNSTDPKEIDEAKKLVASAMPGVKVLNSESFKDILSNGEVWVAHGWGGQFAEARYTTNDKIRYFIPKEGSIFWVDNLAIPKGNKNLENAYTFINYFLDGKANAAVSIAKYNSTPTKTGKQFIKPELLQDPALYPPADVMQRLETIQDVGNATRLYDNAFTELRSQN